LEWVRRFQKFDLYSKDDFDLPNIDQLKSYYLSLIEKYIPGSLAW
jgi:inositol oxygenase